MSTMTDAVVLDDDTGGCLPTSHCPRVEIRALSSSLCLRRSAYANYPVDWGQFTGRDSRILDARRAAQGDGRCSAYWPEGKRGRLPTLLALRPLRRLGPHHAIRSVHSVVPPNKRELLDAILLAQKVPPTHPVADRIPVTACQ